MTAAAGTGIDSLFHEPVELMSTDARSDPRLALDVACYTILAAHVGLTIGTLAKFARDRGDVAALVNSMLKFDTVGLYLLSERGHGLDAFNVESTATLTPEGFILNTPREEASKWMPATTPSFGIPKVAVVMARLIVFGEDRGCRFFIVPICNKYQIGTSPLDFSITTFDHVALPFTALLAESFEAPKNLLQAWWNKVWRIPLGTGAVAAPLVQGLKHAAYIGSSYSLHRHVVGKTPSLISFWTQRCAMVQAQSIDMSLEPSVRHAYSVIAKASIARLCGAQGTFEHNFMARMEVCRCSVAFRVPWIIYSLQTSTVSSSPKETIPGLLRTAREYLATCSDHRSEKANAFVLPQAEAGVSAIGHALAYSAIDAAVPRPLLDVFECAVIRLDAVWYSELVGLSSFEQRMRENRACAAVTPRLDEYLRDLNIARYNRAPIVSDAAWKAYIKLLTTHSGHADSNKDSKASFLSQAVAVRL
ncbi:hypothetical protein L227DRAFT_583521 [Lentinus tigrinus ALCF2SS1-6]|uniref:Acyl-CoA dehydrogenase NM domain-like protein n=1 Tax=Lentinus tigrinus ALCF2SS1-6 TaxID=1328759 RepID=A0A5C2SXN8_9APHY|nr:hypothetical protein L227DRAFT_583521 [Lentinus tigrinus ALCF2SS1-6]